MSTRGMVMSMLVAVVAVIACGDIGAATLLVANKTDGTVDLFDPQTGELRATLPTGDAPHEVAVSPDGRLAAISNYGDRDRPGSTLTLIDIEHRKVAATIKLRKHKRPHGMVWYKGDRSFRSPTSSCLVLPPIELPRSWLRPWLSFARSVLPSGSNSTIPASF